MEDVAAADGMAEASADGITEGQEPSLLNATEGGEPKLVAIAEGPKREEEAAADGQEPKLEAAADRAALLETSTLLEKLLLDETRVLLRLTTEVPLIDEEIVDVLKVAAVDGDRSVLETFMYEDVGDWATVDDKTETPFVDDREEEEVPVTDEDSAKLDVPRDEVGLGKRVVWEELPVAEERTELDVPKDEIVLDNLVDREELRVVDEEWTELDITDSDVVERNF